MLALTHLVEGDEHILLSGETSQSLTWAERVGMLAVTSGRVVAHDPYVSGKPVVVAEDVPLGDYPVVVLHHQWDVADDIACLAVQVRPTRPVQWQQMAGVVLVDSAHASIADATAAEVSGAPPSERWHWQGTQRLIVRLIQDGGYGAYQGMDAAGKCCWIAVVFDPLASWRLWPTHLPPPPAGCDARFFQWLRDLRSVQAYPDEWLDHSPVPAADIDRLRAELGQPLPPDILRCYQWARPWQEATLEPWWPAWRARFSARLGTEALLPLGHDRVAALTAGGKLTFYEWFAGAGGVEVFTYRCHLRGYLLLGWLQGLGKNPVPAERE